MSSLLKYKGLHPVNIDDFHVAQRAATNLAHFWSSAVVPMVERRTNSFQERASLGRKTPNQKLQLRINFLRWILRAANNSLEKGSLSVKVKSSRPLYIRTSGSRLWEMVITFSNPLSGANQTLVNASHWVFKMTCLTTLCLGPFAIVTTKSSLARTLSFWGQEWVTERNSCEGDS